ncbi:unnamed protein product [Owenia fusiformis]|uniref:Uncharacterized protein n=1 Tax=Owenia fusiformis TaxID=6347 RepID=A0A8J1Y4Y6_OWEFU|nr:unnamed protein product [Owenia fusiformis]
MPGPDIAILLIVVGILLEMITRASPAHIDINLNIKSQLEDQMRLEIIKTQILGKLGLEHKPNVTRDIPQVVYDKVVNKFRSKLQNHPKAKEVSNYYAKPKEIISFAEPATDNSDPYSMQFIVKSQSPEGSINVTNAVLWVLMQCKRHKCPRQRLNLKVYAKGKNGKYDSHIKSTRVKLSHTSWKKIRLPLDNVQEMFDSKKNILQYVVKCENCSNDVQPLYLRKNKNMLNKHKSSRLAKRRPFLVLHTKVKPSLDSRKKRRTAICDPGATGQQCCKRFHYISFAEIGWDDWILSPKGYYANFCDGSCPTSTRPEKLNSYHAIVINGFRQVKPRSAIQQCCTPKKLRSLSLVYLDDSSNIIASDLSEMIVDECGCS